MVDGFFEFTVKDINKENNKKKYSIFNILSGVFCTFSICWGIYSLIFFDIFSLTFVLAGLIPLTIFITCAVIFSKFRNEILFEFDYQLISGDLVFNKIYNEKRGVNFLKLTTREIDKIGVYGSKEYNKIISFPYVKVYILTPNKTPSNLNDFYYISFQRNGVKNIAVLECDKKFISHVILYSNRNVVDEELKKL